eukprot:PhM_4_TR16358/c0_g2_i1/m.81850
MDFSVWRAESGAPLVKAEACSTSSDNDDIEDDAFIRLLDYEAFHDYITSTQRWAVAGAIPERTLRYFRSEWVVADVGIGKDPVHNNLRRVLLPHQLTAVEFALHPQRNGRVLLADEMGTGKTLQAIATMDSLEAYPCLVVCPASVRVMWADQLERWLPHRIEPRDVHLVQSCNDRLGPHEIASKKVVLISFCMLRLLADDTLVTLSTSLWKMLVVDESHALRTTEGSERGDSIQSKLVRNLAAAIPHVLLLSGTPSVNRPFDAYEQINLLRPGLLGASKYDFALRYCDVTPDCSFIGSTCTRPRELAVLLRNSVMIRRTKAEVMPYLPSKTRTRIFVPAVPSRNKDDDNEEEAEKQRETASGANGTVRHQALYHAIGNAKIEGACEWILSWLSRTSDVTLKPHLICFAHHLSVLDGIGARLSTESVPFLRIDGSTPASARPRIVQALCEREGGARIGLVGVTACALGIDLSFASVCFFAELPPDNGWLRQAEDRLHRHGQHQHVSVFVACLSSSRASTMNKKREGSGGRLVSADESMWCKILCRERAVKAAIDGIEDTKEPHSASSSASHQQQPARADAKMSSSVNPLDYIVSSLGTSAATNESGQLAFSVSFWTRRVHLYWETSAPSCDDVIDAGPVFTPLRANYTRDELFVAADEATPKPLLPGLSSFLDAYDRLPPYQQRRWHGVPSTAPGLLRHNAKRSQSPQQQQQQQQSQPTGRWLPKDDEELRGSLCDVGATWQEVVIKYIKREVRYLQAVVMSEGGNEVKSRLCLWCRAELPKISTPQSEIDLFCSGTCRAEYFVRRSSSAVRAQVYQLEHAQCRGCGVDCDALLQKLKSIATTDVGYRERTDCLLSAMPTLSLFPDAVRLAVYAPSEGALWQVDHVLPVADGGGMCGLENLQTLCTACHRQKTKWENEERRQAKRQRRCRQQCEEEEGDDDESEDNYRSESSDSTTSDR